MFTTVAQFQAYVKSIEDRRYAKMLYFVYLELCKTEGSADVANTIVKVAPATVKTMAFEFGFQG